MPEFKILHWLLLVNSTSVVATMGEKGGGRQGGRRRFKTRRPEQVWTMSWMINQQREEGREGESEDAAECRVLDKDRPARALQCGKALNAFYGEDVRKMTIGNRKTKAGSAS